MRHHRVGTVVISASPEQVFAFVDDQSRLSSHMSESSWMMGGGRMTIELDEGKGQAVGSHIQLRGRVFGIRLFLDEVITRRNPPSEKTWETVGTPHLLVMGSYRMGFQITSDTDASCLRVFIDYDLPAGWATYWLGRLLGGVYANWCVAQMLPAPSRHFSQEIVAAT